MNSIQQNPIVILDFGSQYTQLIARRIRELGVFCEIFPFHVDMHVLEQLNPSGLILSGGPATVTDVTNPRAPEWVFTARIPVLGICYGMQTMAVQLGGQVASSEAGEFGYAELCVTQKSRLFGQTDILDVWMSHGDQVTVLPPHFDIIGHTKNAAIAAMADESRQFYGLQFHPEVTHTPEGIGLLSRFVLDICQAKANWTPAHIIDCALNNIRSQVGQDKVLLGLSGGVDSSVVAAMLHQAIGSQLVCVFVDTGLLRLNEAAQVQAMFEKHLGVDLITVSAESRFFSALESVQCPEKKRQIIGRVFIEVFEEEAKKIPDVKWLAQGTIYPDVIESAASNSDGTLQVIKSHHNVGGLPEHMHLKLLEPIRELFKDEVRKIGLSLGLPRDMIFRHPFPGPGLAVRILGEVREVFVDLLRQADAIFIEELHKAKLYDEVSQAFAVFLPVKSVGVMGDGRRYDYVICLRAVKTIDFMTAEWAHLPWDFLGHVSQRIINELRGISRVTYDISGKPPATIEWE
jgi:GMP synthase (glutamine-hydrolysing)